MSEEKKEQTTTEEKTEKKQYDIIEKIHSLSDKLGLKRGH